MRGKLSTRASAVEGATSAKNRPFACSTAVAGVIAVIAAGWSTSALAQAAAPAPAANSGVGEIVVTAQKRAQNIQDVPVAVTAVSPLTLQVNRVTTVNDLTGLAPGLLSRENPGGNASPSFSMRGVFASASQSSQDREISMYLDGVYLGGTRGSIFDLPDLERIEVLRGPQGTLFGRNSTAGAISAVTRDPTGQFNMRQDFTVGNYSQFRTRTTIDSPQMGPFSAYVTYVHDKKRGDVRNLGAGTQFDRTGPRTMEGITTSPKWLGSHDTNSVFAALKFEPSDDFKMVNKFDWSHTDDTPGARANVAINPNSFIGGLLLQILGAQTPGDTPYGPYADNPSNKRPKAVNNAWTMPGFVEAWGDSLTTSLQATDHLSFKNITAYRHTKTIGISSFTGVDGLVYTQAAKDFFTAPQAFLGGASYAQALGANGNLPVGSYFQSYGGNQSSYERQVSSELQANYTSRLMTLTVGGLWYHSFESDNGLPDMAPTFAFGPVPFQIPLGNIQNSTSKNTSLAAYAQGEIHLTHQLDIVVGGRVTKDKKDTNLISGGTFVGTRSDGSVVGATPNEAVFKSTKPTSNVGINYKPDRDILLYGKVGSAFLSGGAVGPISFKPETVLSEELGLKSEWFDRRVRFNVALWNAVYHHQQSAQSGSVVADPDHPGQFLSQLGVVVLDNGTLKARGFDIELTVAPTEGVTIGGSVGYDHAYLTDPNPLLTSGRVYKQGGVAPWTATAWAQYQTRPLWNDANLFFRIDANYQGRYRAISFPDIHTTAPVFVPYEFSPARWILNGRVALQNIKVGPVTGELGVWARNMSNNRDVLYLLQFGDFNIDASYQQARTFGLDLIFKLK